jgi:hypothetical protein
MDPVSLFSSAISNLFPAELRDSAALVEAVRDCQNLGSHKPWNSHHHHPVESLHS